MLLVRLSLFLCLLWAIFATTPRSDINNDLVASVTLTEQRAYIKIECAGGSSAADISRRLNTILGSNAFSESRVRQLCQEFRSGTRVESICSPPEGRARTATSTEQFDRLLELIAEDDSITVAQLANSLSVSERSVQRMLNEIGYEYKHKTLVPRVLTDAQKARRVETARMHLREYERNPDWLHSIIVIDETWLPQYTPLTDTRSGSWISPGDPEYKISLFSL